MGPRGLRRSPLVRIRTLTRCWPARATRSACPCPAVCRPASIDVGVEVRAHPDQFSPEPDAAGWPALLVDGVPVHWADLPSARDPQAGARLWVDEDTSEYVLLHAVAIQPLQSRGSVVLGIGLDAQQAARIWAMESVTGRAGQ